MAKIIISLPNELLKELDAYALKHKYNRSELIRAAIRRRLEQAENAESV